MSIVPCLDLNADRDSAGIPHAPANIEAEQALLGAVLYDNAAFERLSDALRAEHFYEPFHQRLFEAIESHIRRGRLAEPILLADQFSRDPAFEELGGVAYLADLVDRAPPAANAADYSLVIHDLAIRRDLIRIGGDIAATAQAPDEKRSPQDQIEAAEQQLYSLAETGQQGRGLVEAQHYLAGAVEMAAKAFARDGGLSGLATGLTDLDKKIGGLHPSDLVILAGRPSMGKTSLACNIAFNAARAYRYEALPDGERRTISGGRVAFFSLEMSAEQLGMRLLGEASGVPSDRIRRGEIDARDFARLRDAAMELSTIPLAVDDTGGISLAKLRATARRHQRLNGLDLIVVDYLQLMTSGERMENRVQEVSLITQGLKAIAKELDVPIIALSQLSRQVEGREDKRPQLSDLRDSGSIEQDADMVMFVYREEYYLSRSEPDPGSNEHFDWQLQMDQARGRADLIIGKQRHGPIGVVRLAFDEALTKFSDEPKDHQNTHFRSPTGDE